MQLIVKDLFKLPSLRKARLIAGKEGIYRPVSGATILEMTEMDRDNATQLLAYSLKKQEAMITALYNVRSNPEKQCEVIQNLNRLKAAGLIVFYYGFVVKTFDEKVLSLCDSLHFPLIVLDHEENKNVAYADVLNEIYSLRRHENNSAFRTAIGNMWRVKQEGGNIQKALSQIALPNHLDIAVIDIASKQILCSTLDERHRQLFCSEILRHLPLETSSFELRIDDVSYYGQRHYTDYLETTILLICTQQGSRPDVETISSCVKLGIDLWRRELVLTRGDALVNAVMQGNLRQAKNDLAYYQQEADLPWHFLICDTRRPTGELLNDLKTALHGENITYMEGHYERLQVVLFHRERDTGKLETIVRAGLEQIPDLQIICAKGLCGEEELFRLLRTALARYSAITALYRGRRLIGRFELMEAEFCQREDSGQETTTCDAERLLQPLIDYDRRRSGLLLETLQVFLLDCDMSYKRTSELMFTHTNTVQYRIKKAAELLETSFGQAAALTTIYHALCVYRQNKQKSIDIK